MEFEPELCQAVIINMTNKVMWMLITIPLVEKIKWITKAIFMKTGWLFFLRNTSEFPTVRLRGWWSREFLWQKQGNLTFGKLWKPSMDITWDIFSLEQLLLNSKTGDVKLKTWTKYLNEFIKYVPSLQPSTLIEIITFKDIFQESLLRFGKS